MGLKFTLQMQDYWRSNVFWHCELIPMVFSQDHFEALLKYLHWVDNSSLCESKDDEQYDKTGKVKWVLEHFIKRSRALFN